MATVNAVSSRPCRRRCSPRAKIAVGKLVAAWPTALVFLAVSLPLIVWCVVEGGVSMGRMIGTLIVMAAEVVPKPFAVLADSTSGTAEWERAGFDPLQTIREGLRSARDPDSGWSGVASTEKAVWPYGLAFNLLLGVGALTLTIRRLRTPYERLPRGVRVA